ncbi:hypothetical protein Gpo141_00003112 [Globisporangium polare]
MFATQTKSLKALVPAGARLVTRGGGAKELQKYQQLQHAVGISTWDRVRSSMWHPMATMEQSLMDVERMTSQLFPRSMLPFSGSLLPRMRMDDDVFFDDIEVNSPKEAPKPELKDKAHQQQQQRGDNRAHSFSSYSFNSSTVIDKEGHRVSTIRRRYEDSSGMLKAFHEREIDGKRLKDVWKRKSPEDKGEHRLVTHDTSAEEFEEQWKHTPFGHAEMEHEQQKLGHDKKKQGEKHQGVEARSEHEQVAKDISEMQNQPASAFGKDYAAADAAPDKECGKEAQGVTKEAKMTTRKEAIAQGSKTQEEETTLPQYTS